MNAEPNAKDLLREDSDTFLMRKVEQALKMSPEDRFRAGGELFELACEVARAGIRARLGNPEAPIVEEYLRERLEMEELLAQNDRAK